MDDNGCANNELMAIGRLFGRRGKTVCGGQGRRHLDGANDSLAIHQHHIRQWRFDAFMACALDQFCFAAKFRFVHLGGLNQYTSDQSDEFAK